MHPLSNLFQQFLLNAKSGLPMSIRLGIATGVSFFLGMAVNAYFDKMSMATGGLWSAISTILVMQNYVGGSVKAAWQRFLGTFLGALFAGFFVSWIGHGTVAIGICVFCITLICFSIRLQDSFRLASMTAAIVLVLWGMEPQISPWKFSLLRFMDSVIGISVGLTISCFFWSAQAKHKMRDNFLFILERVYQLLREPPHPDEEIHLKRLEDIDKEIRETAPIIAEAKVELMIGRHLEMQAWEALFHHLVQMIEALKVILNISRTLLDDPQFLPHLSNHFEIILESFKALEMALLHPNVKIKIAALEQCILQVKQSLEHFYVQTPLKGVPMEKAALFFVYYYNLKLLSDELQEALNVNRTKLVLY